MVSQGGQSSVCGSFVLMKVAVLSLAVGQDLALSVDLSRYNI